MSPASGDLKMASFPDHYIPFPINRWHQQVVTKNWLLTLEDTYANAFPINRCHQQVVTVPPERVCAASDLKAVCAPPYLGRLCGCRQACGKR